ncbi:MAG: flagellar basal body L-ring protein FlgH [Campylobacterota bacterium]|nr:flagellar basal body L-ring protein FlgH [Campylobacterota bacterium]
MIKTILNSLMVIYVILSFTGCTAKLSDPELNFEPPVYVEEMPSKEDKKDFVSTGSIFGQGSRPLFSDRKAMNVNDIVTVSISETATSSSSGAKKLSESDSTKLGGGAFTSAGGNTAMGSYATKLSGITNMGFTSATENAFSGQGTATRDASFTTKVTARVVKVLKNGNYFISGRKDILVDDQKQIIQVSGVIRPYDIDQYNTISSSLIGDAKILYKTEGDIDRATKQGWGTKIIQAIWPF